MTSSNDTDEIVARALRRWKRAREVLDITGGVLQPGRGQAIGRLLRESADECDAIGISDLGGRLRQAAKEAEMNGNSSKH